MSAARDYVAAAVIAEALTRADRTLEKRRPMEAAEDDRLLRNRVGYSYKQTRWRLVNSYGHY